MLYNMFNAMQLPLKNSLIVGIMKYWRCIMARIKPKQVPSGTDYQFIWETELKPLILSYYGEVPIEVVSKVLGFSENKIHEQLQSGEYKYGIARKCKGDTYRYEFMPLRLIAYVEGRLLG
jgi:hypothetical protein